MTAPRPVPAVDVEAAQEVARQLRALFDGADSVEAEPFAIAALPLLAEAAQIIDSILAAFKAVEAELAEARRIHRAEQRRSADRLAAALALPSPGPEHRQAETDLGTTAGAVVSGSEASRKAEA